MAKTSKEKLMSKMGLVADTMPYVDETKAVRFSVCVENRIVDGKKKRVVVVDDFFGSSGQMKHEFTDVDAAVEYIKKCFK